MFRFTRRRAQMLLGVVVTLAVAGAAFAFWTGGGSGSGGGAAAGAQTPLTANQTTTLAAMYPGDSPQTIAGDFDNLNSGPIYVSTVTVRVEGVQAYTTTTASLDPSGVSTVQIGNDTKSQAFVAFADDLEVR